ncbi:MAG: phosphoribosylanthranilate isomerase [Janthinobacterium lividum]
MTRIKICGITNREDALAAAEAGADALGFNAIPSSPRYVDTQENFEITENLPMFIQCVTVVQRPGDEEEYVPDYVQHYEDTAAESRATGLAWKRIRAFRMRDESVLDEITAYADPVGAILLDTYHKDFLGGSGETFDWSLAVRAKALTNRPIILAGGLTPENVKDALEAVRPYAVDVCSGVEVSPGVKDHAKIKAFVRAVREWDLAHDRELHESATLLGSNAEMSSVEFAFGAQAEEALGS